MSSEAKTEEKPASSSEGGDDKKADESKNTDTTKKEEDSSTKAAAAADTTKDKEEELKDKKDEKEKEVETEEEGEEVRIYVGNMSFDSTKDSLRTAFSEFGTVTDVFIPRQPNSRRPRGFAFVTMSNREDATKAIAEMHEKEIDGRVVNVNEAQPKPVTDNDNTTNRDNNKKSSPGRKRNTRKKATTTAPAAHADEEEVDGVKLYVGNISFDTKKDSLREVFEEYGTVNDCFIPLQRGSHRPRGFAFVTMATDEEAKKAVSGTDGTEIDGRVVKVNVAQPKGFGIQPPIADSE